MAKFVKITSTDEQGEFTVTGQLLRENKEGALVRTGIAEMFFPNGDYSMSNARSPRNFNATVESATEVIAEAKAKQPRKAKAKAAPKAKKVTNIDKAIELITAARKENPEITRKETIFMLVEKLDIEVPTRAASLYQTAIKRM